MSKRPKQKSGGGNADQLGQLLALHEIALGSMSHGLCMYDAAQKLALFNQRFLETYKLSPGAIKKGDTIEAVYRRCATSIGLSADVVDALWIKRRARLDTGKAFNQRQRIPDGRAIALDFRPLPDGGWVAVFEDITHQQEMEEQLRQQVERMDQALENMSHGLSMFDADERLIVCNRQYVELYDLDAEVIKPGVTHKEVLENWVARGNSPAGNGESLYQSRRAAIDAGNRSEWLSSKDGRIIEATSRRTPDGGWVTASDDITARLRSKEILREQNLRFDAALENLAHGLCMLDQHLCIVVCNRRYLEMYGLDPEIVKPGATMLEVIQHSVARGNHGHRSADAVYEDFCQKVTTENDVVKLRHLADGRCFAIRSRPMTTGGWAVTYEDVTQREHATQTLREQNMRFDAALNNMSQGLCMYDADLRLIVHNDKYLELFNYDAEYVKPGVMLLDVLGHGIARGTFPNGTDDVLRIRLSALQNGTTSFDQVITGDRIIATTHCPMPDGGFVGTFEDITERRRVESERKAAIIELREQHRRFDAALNNMPLGVSMLDHDLRIIVTNNQWLDMFGLSPDVVKPGVTMQEVMRHSVAVGNYRDIDAEDLYRDLTESLEAGVSKFYRNLTNGRTVLTTYHAMTEGGYVATYEDITERKQAEERISHMARHDALTGLPNRVLFRDKMDEGLARVQAENECMAVLCLDLDNFKSVNDTLGHPIGDRFLISVANLLSGVIGEKDTIARLGGDEFAILQCASQPAGAERLAQRIIEALNDSLVIEDNEINTAVSIGIAVAPHDGDSADHLMKCADLALYRAKAQGRARHCFFEPAMDTHLQERRALEIDLRKAFPGDQFSIVYQPQIRLSDGEISGMEALLRWTHPQRGSVSPAEFIPVAEESGLIIPLGEWVLRGACAEAARWPDHIRLAVNLSAVQFKHRGLVASILNALGAAGLPPRRLELEITEAVLLQDDEATLRVLHQLRALGIRISMDDFGTGYSSLSYLRSFPFDKLKIDRSFVSDTGFGKDSAAIIRTIAGLGASLGIDTTAEGVETAEQLEMVRRSGCTEYQGYYFSPPRSAAEVSQMMTRVAETKAVA